MTLEEKISLVKQNTQEILTEKELKILLKENPKPRAYYGTATTGPFHIGYLIPLGKIFDFEKAGIETTILLADIHAALDDLKSKWEELELKTQYYKKCVELALPWTKTPNIVKGSSFQIAPEYFTDVLKVSSLATINRAKRAASEVTRMREPKVSELIYPIMQSLDEQYLNADIQLGGTDQRHIFAFARKYLPLIGYKPRVEVMTPLILSLKGPGSKMSASDPMTNIKVYDSEDSITQKINKAYCPEGDILENPIMQICQYLIFPIKGSMKIKRESKYGGSLHLKSYEDLETIYSTKELYPLDLKNSVSEYMTNMFEKPRNYFKENKELLAQLGTEFLAG